jgi:hypothetical protein
MGKFFKRAEIHAPLIPLPGSVRSFESPCYRNPSPLFATVQSGQKGIIWLARLVVVRAPPAVELGSMGYLRR